ncbi:hypothetical protein [Algoriella sp.]
MSTSRKNHVSKSGISLGGLRIKLVDVLIATSILVLLVVVAM